MEKNLFDPPDGRLALLVGLDSVGLVLEVLTLEEEVLLSDGSAIFSINGLDDELDADFSDVLYSCAFID